MGWRALAPCVTSLHPETDRLEAKQLRVCLLSKRAEVLRQKSKVKVKSRSQRCARPQERGLGFALALAASRLASCPLAILTGFCFALAKGPLRQHLCSSNKTTPTKRSSLTRKCIGTFSGGGGGGGAAVVSILI